MFIVILVLVWLLLAAVILGVATLHRRLRTRTEHRKKEALHRWAQNQREINLGKDDETWHRNQEMDLR
jgi:predicted Holliday junction resolvase-like endonuclease